MKHSYKSKQDSEDDLVHRSARHSCIMWAPWCRFLPCLRAVELKKVFEDHSILHNDLPTCRLMGLSSYL